MKILGSLFFLGSLVIQKAACLSSRANQTNKLAMKLNLHSVQSSGSVAADGGGSGGDQLLTVLIHGLDSSSRTWTKPMEKISTPCIAMDQRGCGFSDLGDPADFTQEALVNDIHGMVVAAMDKKSSFNGKIVLLGHSLGGRIALAYAATYPDNVMALIIEDMDIVPRPADSSSFQVMANTDKVFDQRMNSLESSIANLKKAGYPDARVESWAKEGRIEHLVDKDGDGSTYWWSHVNPMFRKLCYQHVLATSKARENCHHITNSSIDNEDNLHLDFPVHLLVAGSDGGTVCKEESVQEMKKILGDQLTIHRYPSATHSIHSSAPEEFHATIESIISDASQS